MKFTKKKLLSLAAVMTIISGTNTFASEVQSRAYESWSARLPANHGNYYAPGKYKTTEYGNGNVSVATLKGSPGINAWLNTGDRQGPIRISNIASITRKGTTKYPLTYQSHSTSGTKVYLGVEDHEKTATGLLNSASGQVDYK